MWLFLLLLGLPLIEIALFVIVGGWIGLWPTLALVVLAAAGGILIVRLQGIRAMDDLRRSFETAGDPARPLAQGAMILLAGLLLVLPGFFTDAVGLLLLLPPVRNAVLRRMRGRVQTQGFVYRGRRPGEPRPPSGDVIEGEFRELPDDRRPTHHPDERTRH